MPEKAKRTRGRWQAFGFVVVTAARHVASCIRPGVDVDDEDTANAAFIALAANAHDDLIDVLEQADERLEHDATCDRQRSGHCRCIKSVIARVLKQARGE